MVQAFRNCSLSVKAAVFCLLLAAGVAAIATVPYQGLVRSHAELRNLTRYPLSKQAAADALTRQVADVQIGLLRLARAHDQKAIPATLADLRRAPLADARALSGQLQDLRQRADLSEAERVELEAAAATWTYHQKAVRDALAEGSAAAALRAEGGLLDVTRRFQAMAQSFAEASSRLTADAVAADAENLRAFQVAGGLAAVWALGLGLLSARVFVQPFREISRAMLAIAGGQRSSCPADRGTTRSARC